MKIAIIGAGVSGLSVYLQLQKELSKHQDLRESIEITLYETHNLQKHDDDRQKEGIPSTGGGYGVAANGMKSLKRLDPKIYEEVFRNSFPTPRMRMMSARGWTLGSIDNVDDSDGHPENCCMVLREVVIDTLYKRIPSSAITLRKVVSVVDTENGVTIKLDNGDEASFDLVIGADGVWSKTRMAILGRRSWAEYNFGGFVSTDHLPKPVANTRTSAPNSQTVMTMGPNGFFGYTPCTSGEISATSEHIRGDIALPPGKIAFWWSRSAQINPEADPDEDIIHRDLESRVKFWKDPTIHKILQNSKIIFKIPTFTLPKLPSWAGQRAVLIGDAAHALPSSSGQGVSQALEDAETLSVLLVHNLASLDTDRDPGLEFKALQETFWQYMTARKAHVEAVLDDGNRSGDSSRDMGIIAEYFMYIFLWITLRFFSSFVTKTIRNYDVIAEVNKVIDKPMRRR